MRRLQWHKNGDGTWLASASRAIGGRYQITVREFADGRVFDVHRLVRTGPDVWRPSYIGSGTTLERAQAIARANYQRLQRQPAASCRAEHLVGML
jgi:hypothetical protein